ncbi:MAG: peptide deformylase [Bdellovibrionota bacterium]
MAILEIVQYPDPRLREKCKPVDAITAKLQKTIDDMVETMYNAPGIGLAASQIGLDQRVIVVDIGDDEETGKTSHLYKIINPEIVERGGKIDYEEGCLSIPGIKETVRRASRVVLVGVDETGKELEVEAEGLLAVCFQHEIDHLDGVLFIDHLSRVKKELIKSRLAKRKNNS